VQQGVGIGVADEMGVAFDWNAAQNHGPPRLDAVRVKAETNSKIICCHIPASLSCLRLLILLSTDDVILTHLWSSS
jgi:hypothetical protein